MSMSGIKMSPELSGFYNELNLKKTHKFAGFKLTDDMKLVIVDKAMLGDKAQTSTKEEDKEHFDKLKAMLKSDEPRYVLYDFGFPGKDGRDVKKIGFLYWCSEDCPVRKRMIYTSTKDTVMKCLQQAKSIQVNDLTDMNYDEITAQIEKF